MDWLQEDFFGELHTMLSEMPEVKELHPVSDARVPVTKFKFNGVSIDLYAKLSLWVIPENVEANKADWNTTFEPYPFFEVYKNYLQIDVTAANPDDLRNGKGWVESCLRQLTLKIERDTFNMLQCHPHPGDVADKSKPFHCCYYMVLQRKQRVQANEDICEPCQTEERLNFVFPGEVRPLRPAKVAGESKRPVVSKVAGHSEADKSSEAFPRCTSTLRGVHEGSPVSSIATSSTEGGESINGSKRHKNPADRNLRMVDKVMKLRDAFHLLKFFLVLLRHRASFAIGKIMSGPYIAYQACPEEIEELEDEMEYRNQAKELSGSTKGGPLESSAEKAAVTATSTCGAGPFSSVYSNGGLEELEDPLKNGVLEVQAIRNNVMASTLLATTAITLCSLISVYVSNTSNSSTSSSTELVAGPETPVTSSAKYFAILVCFLVAFLCNVQSIRYYAYVSFLITLPTSKDRTESIEYVVANLNWGSFFWSLGLRAFYLSFPFFLWVFGPIAMFVC
ncbi:poly(A) polymerase 1 [Actinidia rufa]|uniref:Poly(A) polymerase 1 n=1 Tax=Actinidia rufa TaxID=165716 RepID=A0A7J0DG08_9ERIC|nr:poly(A) polymerase 1 [Actinidia rufa]